MPAHSTLRFTDNSSHRQPSRPIKKLSSAEQVKQYTADLILKKNCEKALTRLWQLNCPMSVFEENEVEKVLKQLEDQVKYKQEIDALFEKFATLRRREARAAAKDAKNKKPFNVMEDEQYRFFDVVVRKTQEIEAQLDKSQIDQVFASAFGAAKKQETRRFVRPDYSKYKIVKKSRKSGSTSPITSNSSPTGSHSSK